MPNCGIVDVGSNTIRLSIYRLDKNGFQLLLNKKEMAGLAGYVWDGVLSDEGIQRAIQALSHFRTLCDTLSVDSFYVFATASLRNISNTDEAVEAIRTSTGINVTVLSGSEEAALSFLGVFHDSLPAEGPGLFVDIGGGSTELVVYEGNAIRTGTSLPIGSLSLFTQHVEELFPTPAERKAMAVHVRKALSSVEHLSCPHLIGVGGTIRAIGKFYGLSAGVPLPAQEVQALYHRLKKGDRDTLRHILQVAPERIHTFFPGLIILRQILKAYEVEAVTISPYSVREGYLLTHVLGKESPCVQG